MSSLWYIKSIIYLEETNSYLSLLNWTIVDFCGKIKVGDKVIEGNRIMLISMGEMEDEFKEKENLELIKSAGGFVVSKGFQNSRMINPKTYFGKGKLDYFKNIADELEVDTIVIGEEISPSQLSNLVSFFDRQVVDRNMLILELFRQRAKTSFGKLQVELANKEYMYPRLAGANKNMDRQSGVQGMRGAGEQKLELDRRRLRASIDSLKEELRKQRQVEETKAKRRKDSIVPIVSLIGYSNTGKSTIMNKILEYSNKSEGAVYADDRLFATLDTSARLVDLPHGGKFILTDTVGLISNLPHQLIEAFSSTLEEMKDADLLIHVMDASSDNLIVEKETTNNLIEELSIGEKRILNVFNKVDKAHYLGEVPDESLIISAFKDEDIYKLLTKIEELLYGKVELIEKFFLYSDYGGLDNFIEDNHVVSVIHEEEGTRVRAYVYEK